MKGAYLWSQPPIHAFASTAAAQDLALVMSKERTGAEWVATEKRIFCAGMESFEEARALCMRKEHS